MTNDRYIPEEYTENCAKQLDFICDQAFNACLNINGLDLTDKTVLYSCSIKFLEKAAKYIGIHPETVLDIGGLLEFSVENREDDKGEKAGNIVPVVKIGDKFIKIIKGDHEEDLDINRDGKYTPETYPESCTRELDKICDEAMVAMEHENNVDVTDPTVIYTALIRFIERVAEFLATNKDNVIDISSLIKFRIEDKKKLIPGVEIGERFKLAVKNDDATEDE